MAVARSAAEVRGIVSGRGKVLAGAGFGVTRTGPGVYAIRFLEPYPEAPLVLATAAEPARAVAAVGTPVGAEVTLTDPAGVRADGGFAFAVEPADPSGGA
jgi:hypothetical protein